MVCGYEVWTSCEVSSSVTPDGTTSVSKAEAVHVKRYVTFTCTDYTDSIEAACV